MAHGRGFAVTAGTVNTGPRIAYVKEGNDGRPEQATFRIEETAKILLTRGWFSALTFMIHAPKGTPPSVPAKQLRKQTVRA